MITARNLTKRFPDIVALDQLNCNIPDGCIYGLVGANGAGKSTFLRLASGIYRPDDGQISINGGNVYDNPEVKKQFVFVPDELFFLPQSNMIRMAKLYTSAYERFNTTRFHTLTEEFRLNPNKPFSTFSKGMRRQAATILALSTMAEYIFFDETFDGLDPVMRNLVKATLYDDVMDRNCTAVITSHSLRELEDTCDQLALLYKGGIVFESDVQNLKTSLFKIQVAFDDAYDRRKFDGLDILSFNKQGSVSNLIVRGNREESHTRLTALSPILLEVLPLTLEEVFIYEMEALGYVFDQPNAKRGERA
ncbi:MAG: ABC transporter ATP-binding protein [Clostridia bacterium]